MGIERAVSFSWSRKKGIRGTTGQNDMVIIADDQPLEDGDFGSGRLKRYSMSALSSVGTDFGPSSQAYKAFERCAGQDEKPESIFIGKRDAEVAAVATLTFDGDTAAGDVITGAVNGTAISVTFASDAATTLAALAAAIADVWGVAGAVVAGSVITITATAGYLLNVGEFQAAGGDEPGIDTEVTEAGRTLKEDIEELLAENNAPYIIYHTSANAGDVEAAAQAISTRKKLHMYQTADTAVWGSGTADIASRLKAGNFWKSSGWATKDTTKHIPAALSALCLAYDPGKIAFSHRDLVAITADTFTDDEIAYIESKNANTYSALNSEVASTLPGVTSDGSQIHTVRDQHYFEDQLDLALINWLKAQKKATFNNQNLRSAEAAGQNKFIDMENEGVLDPEFENAFTAPTVSSIPSDSKAQNTASGFYGAAKVQNVIIKIAGNIDLQTTV